MTAIDDATLDRLLASVGRHLDVGDEPGAVASDAGAGRRRSHRVLMVAAAVIVVVLVALAVAPVRRTVADWLGIGSTTVVNTPGPPLTLAPLPSITSGLREIDAAGATQRLGHPLPDTAATQLGPPQALMAMPEGGVLMVWPDATTLWVHDTDMPPQILVKKLISAGQEARFVPDVGDGTLSITGEHILVTPHRTIAAGTVLLWTDGDTELRLESDLPLDTMIAVARQLT